jgi:hypothetical protein
VTRPVDLIARRASYLGIRALDRRLLVFDSGEEPF